MAQVLISDVNPIKYVEKDLQFNGNVALYDLVNYKHTVQEFEGYLGFNQKWVLGDIVRQQIATNDIDVIFIQVVDCEGNVLQTIGSNAVPSPSIAIPNFIIDGLAWDIHQFDLDTNLIGEKEFYFVLNFKSTLSTIIEIWISEPQETVADLTPSILFKYSNSYNEFNTIFKTPFGSPFEQHFNLRVEGRLLDAQEEGIFEQYEDQRLDLTELNAKPFTTWLVRLGGAYGVPEWLGKKFNMVRSCNTVFADNYQLSFIDKFSKKSTNNYTRFSYEIKCREVVNNYAKVIQACVPVRIVGTFNMPNAYGGLPYYPYNYVVQLTGSLGFQIDLSTIIKPAWMDIAIVSNTLVFTSNVLPTPIATGVQVYVQIKNKCGLITLTDTIDVLNTTCQPPQFNAAPIAPDGIIGVPYNGFVSLSGSAPFAITIIVAPTWMVFTPTPTGIQLSGIPTQIGNEPINIDISTCGGGASYTLNYLDSIIITN